MAELTVDGLLREAAARDPSRCAIRTEDSSITYGELDRAVDACAAALTGLGGGPGTTVGVVTALDPAFAVAFYGVIRGGGVVVTVNPLLGDEALAHVFAAARIGLAFVTPELDRRLRALRPPYLRELIVYGTALPPGPAPQDPAPDAVACIHFTSGTTGSPKAVPLTHRNLTANAAQVAGAHELAAGTVTLNHLPAYHLMHLDAAVHAGATQVLCRSTDTAEAVALANATAATRLFDLPVRLARLAADPRLPGLRLGTVQAIMSGGSALSPAVATALTNHFCIPVLQGYGLAEASPLTHCDRIADPRPGSVGPAVAGTECAITDLDTGAPLPRGKRGEVRVRGPQVMRGYLDSDEQVVDRDGWLRTGDVGYEDAGGRLYLVDRIGDVFKCDNELVAPTEVERVLLRHPDVADCVVFGVPDEYSGAVAHALIVPACPGTDLGAVMRAVNAGLPYVQELRKVEAVARIPRSPAGKVSRRELGRAYESGER